MEQNEIKRTETPKAQVAPKEIVAKQAVNDFVNEGNPTVSPPKVDEKEVEKIITKLADS